MEFEARIPVPDAAELTRVLMNLSRTFRDYAGVSDHVWKRGINYDLIRQELRQNIRNYTESRKSDDA